MPSTPRRVAHFDLDTFFVAVERLLDPSLIGKPVLVGHPGGRGVVATASYEARVFGCHSAQPMVQALRLCPQAIVVPPSGPYGKISRQFHAMLHEVTPIVESVGLDEAYTDLTGLEPQGGARAVAEGVRARVREEIGIAVSVCIAGSKTVAKVGSDRAKPDGLIEVPVGGDAEFLAPLPIRDLPFVGKRMGEFLHGTGVRTIGDAAALDPRWLESRLGKHGLSLRDRARGVDPAPVVAGGRDARSISREVTFEEDVTDVAALRRVLAVHAERVSSDLRDAGRRARTVTLKLRWPDFTTITRSHTVERPLQSMHALEAAAVTLLDEVAATEGLQPVRLIGLGVHNLVEDAVQLGFEDALLVKDERLDRVLDGLRGRFGDDAVRRGSSNGARTIRSAYIRR